MTARGRWALRVAPILAVMAVVLLVFSSDQPLVTAPDEVIAGPYARLLAEATDLGPAHREQVQLVAALRHPSEPVMLTDWARRNGLSVQWHRGDPWAVVAGASDAVSNALHVPVHDYREPRGQVFYASPQQPAVPQSVRDEVSELGRILGYTPYHVGVPPTPPRDVPDGGLLPTELLSAYNLNALAAGGFTGEGATVVVFAFDGFDQKDMDSFADWFDLPRFTPEVVGGMPTQKHGESTMDLQLIHAVAPQAKLVLVNARSTVEGDGAYVKLGELMRSVDRQFPGAVWSLSIGWGCDRLLTKADLAPVRTALSDAQRNGTTAFDASGDLAGLECKGGKSWSDPPSPDDIGVDAVASIPEMTAVGGTTLSTDADGNWLAEQGWYDVPLTQGSGGGVSTLFPRPSWQAGHGPAAPRDRRLVPDVAAVADPFTGVKFVYNRQVLVGGGTSQSAPIWAAFAALMNQYLASYGLDKLGDLNPLLYEIADGAGVPAFRDIALGANAVTPVHPGYDMITGLGTPNIANLVKDLLVLKAVGR